MTGLRESQPRTFEQWWDWGVCQAEDLSTKKMSGVVTGMTHAPIAIHSQSGSRDDWGNVRPTIIRGLPFTRRFETYVDRARKRGFENGLFTRAMSHLYSRRGRQTDEYKIAYALVSGETNSEHVRIVILGSPHREYFESTAIRALAFIYEKVQADLAAVKDPNVKAGVA